MSHRKLNLQWGIIWQFWWNEAENLVTRGYCFSLFTHYFFASFLFLVIDDSEMSLFVQCLKIILFFFFYNWGESRGKGLSKPFGGTPHSHTGHPQFTLPGLKLATSRFKDYPLLFIPSLSYLSSEVAFDLE